MPSSSALRIGQFTGWHGDRGDGMAELIEAGVDVLTGDYLAELTMLVLQKNRQRGGKAEDHADSAERDHPPAAAADDLEVGEQGWLSPGVRHNVSPRMSSEIKEYIYSYCQ